MTNTHSACGRLVALTSAIAALSLGCSSGSGSAKDGATGGDGQVVDAAGADAAHADGSTTDGSTTDAPKAWPPPGELYLTKLETEADYDRLAAGGADGLGVPFIMRRRGNDQAYPYPWDRYECVFNEARLLHLDFLGAIDPERAVQLYFVDAKSVGGGLLPGRVEIERTGVPPTVNVRFENFPSLMQIGYFPLDAATVAAIRERIGRCVSFPATFVFSMVCPEGDFCPLPD